MAGKTSGMEISEPFATEASFETATSPIRAPIEPIKAPVEPIEAPVAPIEEPVAPIKAPTESNKTSDEAQNSAKSSDDHGLFDSVAKSTS